MAVSEGPFQRIVDVYFPEEDEGSGDGGPYPTQVGVAFYFIGGFYDGGAFIGWTHVIGTSVGNITDGSSSGVRVMAMMTPETIDTPPDDIGGLTYDPERERNYRVITRVSGDKPFYNPETSVFIDWLDASNLITYDGVNAILPLWTTTYREYYSAFGRYDHILLTNVQSEVSMSCTSVRLRSTDGVLYRGVSFNPDNGNIIVEKV